MLQLVVCWNVLVSFCNRSRGLRGSGVRAREEGLVTCMMLTEVSLGLGRALREGTVGISLLLREGTVIVGAEGLMGMAAMLWWRYQAKTGREKV